MLFSLSETASVISLNDLQFKNGSCLAFVIHDMDP